MIIEGLINIVFNILNSVLGSANIPSCPEQLISVLDTAKTYLLSGVSIIGIFVDWPFTVLLLNAVLSMIAFDWVYKIIMWAVRKVPVASIT